VIWGILSGQLEPELSDIGEILMPRPSTSDKSLFEVDLELVQMQ
jgi:hypothetical protein